MRPRPCPRRWGARPAGRGRASSCRRRWARARRPPGRRAANVTPRSAGAPGRRRPASRRRRSARAAVMRAAPSRARRASGRGQRGGAKTQPPRSRSRGPAAGRGRRRAAGPRRPRRGEPTDGASSARSELGQQARGRGRDDEQRADQQRADRRQRGDDASPPAARAAAGRRARRGTPSAARAAGSKPVASQVRASAAVAKTAASAAAAASAEVAVAQAQQRAEQQPVDAGAGLVDVAGEDRAQRERAGEQQAGRGVGARRAVARQARRAGRRSRAPAPSAASGAAMPHGPATTRPGNVALPTACAKNASRRRTIQVPSRPAATASRSIASEGALHEGEREGSVSQSTGRAYRKWFSSMAGADRGLDGRIGKGATCRTGSAFGSRVFPLPRSSRAAHLTSGGENGAGFMPDSARSTRRTRDAPRPSGTLAARDLQRRRRPAAQLHAAAADAPARTTIGPDTHRRRRCATGSRSRRAHRSPTHGAVARGARRCARAFAGRDAPTTSSPVEGSPAAGRGVLSDNCDTPRRRRRDLPLHPVDGDGHRLPPDVDGGRTVAL